MLSWSQVLSDDGTSYPVLDQYRSESFDQVIIDQCLGYLVPPYDQHFLRAVTRLVTIGGQLHICFLNGDKLLERWPTVKDNPGAENRELFDLIYASHGPRRMVRKNLLSARQVRVLALELGLREVGLHQMDNLAGGCTQKSELASLSFLKVRGTKQRASRPPRRAQRRWLTGKGFAVRLDSATRYLLRTRICSLLRVVPGRHRRVNLGCGRYPLPMFTNVDTHSMPWIDYAGHMFEFLEGVTNHTLYQIHMSHVLEHLTYDDAEHLLRLARRKLRRGGVLDISVPDFAAMMRYLEEGDVSIREKDRVVRRVCFGGHSYYGNYHLYAYTYLTLKERLSEFGFPNVVRVKQFSRWPFWDSAELTLLGSQNDSLNVRAS